MLKHTYFTLQLSLIILLLLFSCGSGSPGEGRQQQHDPGYHPSAQFNDFWYKGKAELTSYNLRQVRYGQINEGEAVLIFVTEDFSKKDHIKINDPKSRPDEVVKILKLNAMRKFNTGLYPYSMMNSVFTPVNKEVYPKTLRVTCSSQEWCGHTFTLVDWKEDKYMCMLHSYFDGEGDEQFRVGDALLEDEIWMRIRINPDDLPTGEVEVIPATFYQRFKHSDLKPETATASLEEQGEQRVYTLAYQSIDRNLAITFNKAFPHEIISWEESHVSGWGNDAKKMTTTATRKESLMLDYWNKNGVADSVWRKKLLLD